MTDEIENSFSADYCGKTCVSDCKAHAECGKDALDPDKPCPLNVCCSQYGFCVSNSAARF